MQFDSLRHESWDEGMWERLRWLRENDPVHWDAQNGLWVVTRHADVSAVSKQSQVFCSGGGVRPGNPVRLSLVDMDEPRHGQLRRLVNRGFTPRRVARLETSFRRLARQAVDRVAERGECDFVRDIAVPLPLALIAEMIGIPAADWDRFHRWSDALIGGDGHYGDPEALAASAAAFVEYADYLQHVFEARRREPRDDLVSVLVNARDEGVLGEGGVEAGADPADFGRPGDPAVLELANDELVMFMVLLLVAGNETTRNAITGGMSALIENPDEREKLVRDPGLMKSAVEEVVRYVSPVLNFARTATRDAELRGRRIARGQKLLLVYPSANRDAEVFDEPDRFRVDRQPNPHLGFGVGNHFCLGANLARMELRVVLEECLRRLPDMEYAAGPPRSVPSTLVRSFVAMPVRFTPERAAA
jgi:cytochrome P450 family 142 subfamily A polypeptide 1